MAFDSHNNFAYGTVTNSVGTAGTTVIIGTANFASFPDPSTNAYNCTVWPAGTIPLASNAEIVRVVTKGTNGTIEVNRTQESTTARNIGVGDQFAVTITKKTVTDIEDTFGTTSYSNLLKNGNFINNSTNGYGSTPDDWTSSSGNPVQGGFPAMTKQNVIDLLGVTDGQIEGLWNLTEASGNATDLSSNGYNLTDTNTVTSTDDGLMGKARTFTAANSEYLTIADASAPSLDIAGAKTVFCWIKLTSVATWQQILGKSNGSTASQGYDIYISNTNIARWGEWGLTTTNVSSDIELKTGKWYFIVAVTDTSNNLLKIWINGVKKQVSTSGTPNTDTSSFDIGYSTANSGNAFDGSIQNVGVLSVALSDSQVKRLWAATTYRGQKIRRATSNGALTQALEEDLVERLRGKTVTLRAKMWQDTASTGQIDVNDGSANLSATDATTGSWVDVSTTVTISSTATAITVKLEANTSDSNVWFKEVSLYEGSNALPYTHSADDWNRFPRLLKLDAPAVISAYEFEENRLYTWSITYTGFSSDPTQSANWLYRGNTCFLTNNLSAYGTSNLTTFTMSIPIVSSSAITQQANGNIMARDNGTNLGSISRGDLSASATSLSIKKSNSSESWTSSGGKGAYVNASYIID